MRRILLLSLPLAILASLLTSTTAQAATSTCSTHQATVIGWNIQDNSITGHWDFQCGGANNDDWRITYSIWLKQGLFWTPIQCANGQNCNSTRPTAGNPPFAGGSEHSGNFTFTPTTHVDCTHWRVHANVAFSSGDEFNTNGPEQFIGC